MHTAELEDYGTREAWEANLAAVPPTEDDDEDHIERGYNFQPNVVDHKTVQFQIASEPVEKTAREREGVTWLQARGSDVLNIITLAQDAELVEEHVVNLMKVEAKAFAHTKTGEIVLPAVKGLSEVEQEAVMARALIESVRESDRVSEEETISVLRSDLELSITRIQELEAERAQLAATQDRIAILEALITPDMLTQAQVVRDQAERIKALEVRNKVLESRAERPRRTISLNAGFLRTALDGLRIG